MRNYGRQIVAAFYGVYVQRVPRGVRLTIPGFLVAKAWENRELVQQALRELGLLSH